MFSLSLIARKEPKAGEGKKTKQRNKQNTNPIIAGSGQAALPKPWDPFEIRSNIQK